MQSDYRKINYWTEGVYREEDKRRKSEKGKASMSDAKAQRGSKRLSEDDENIMFWLIEDEDGNPIPGQRAKAARDQARKIWRYLDRSGRLPDCWNEADTVASSYYTGEMRCFFPELQLCENDYKANRIATLIFPNFLKHRNSKVKEEIKEDSEDVDNAAAAVVAGKKRAASEAPDDEPASKRTPVSGHTRAVKPRPKPKPKKKTPSVPAPAAPSATPEPVSVVSASVPPAPAPATTQPAPPSPPAAPSPPAPPPQPAPTSQPSQPVLPSQPAPSAAGVPSLPITTYVSAPPALALALLSSVAVASATGLSTGTNDNDLEPAVMDNICEHLHILRILAANIFYCSAPRKYIWSTHSRCSRLGDAASNGSGSRAIDGMNSTVSRALLKIRIKSRVENPL